MKLIFKTETEILKELEISSPEDIEAVQEELKVKFDDKLIKKYEITFIENVVVKQCHNIADVFPHMVSVLTITILE